MYLDKCPVLSSKTWTSSDLQAAQGHRRHQNSELRRACPHRGLQQGRTGGATAIPWSRRTYLGVAVIRWCPLGATLGVWHVLCPFADKLVAVFLQLFMGFSDGQELSFAMILSTRHGVTTPWGSWGLEEWSNSPEFSGRKSPSQDSEQVCPALKCTPFHSSTALPSPWAWFRMFNLSSWREIVLFTIY